MATETAPRGRGVQYAALRHEAPAAYGVLDPGAALAFRFYTNSIAETETLESDDVLGAPSVNQRDQTDFQDGLPTVAGDMTVPVCCNEFGDHLTMLFGAPVSIDDPGDAAFRLHTWTSGADILPTAQFEQERRPGERQNGAGLVWNSLRLQAEKQSGTLRATIGLMGRSLTPPTIAASVFTAIQRRDYLPIARRQAGMTIDAGAVASVISNSITWNNNIQAAPYLDGTEYAAGMIAGESTSNGSVRARYTTGQLAALGLARTEHAVKVKWSRDDDYWLEMSNPRVRFQKVGTPVSGPGFEDIDYSFVAAQDAGGAAVEFTLRNQIPNYDMPV